MLYDILFVCAGYLSGSVLFAEVFSRLFGKNENLHSSKDNNPGTANSFMQCGFWCGTLTLLGDVLKGFLPVFLYFLLGGNFRDFTLIKPLIFAAPVLGHVLPLFFRFKGGKGIAVTFGCLFGILPMWEPLAVFALSYIFLSVILRINPHRYRTIIAYILSAVLMIVMRYNSIVICGFVIAAAIVILKHIFSKELSSKFKVNFLWMH